MVRILDGLVCKGDWRELAVGRLEYDSKGSYVSRFVAGLSVACGMVGYFTW